MHTKHTHTRTHARTHARTHTDTHACTHARTHTHTHSYYQGNETEDKVFEVNMVLNGPRNHKAY